MIEIILKIILCSTFLIGFYYFLLRKERTFKFNRIFLLSALVFSYTIPFVKFNIPVPQKSPANLIFEESVQEFQQINYATNQVIDNEQIALILYVIISGFFLLKFSYSFIKIKFLKGESLLYKGQKILILNHASEPFSFINTIYISRNYLINNEVQEQIFLHEKCHIEEKHSFDILFLELLKIFSWFNPVLFLYKKAMIANHEFMADDAVLRHDFEILSYQNLILNEIKTSLNYKLTHQFNFNNTKKRFIMMTTKNSRFNTTKRFAVLPVLAILFVLFTNKVEAKIEIKTASEPTSALVESKVLSISKVEMNATPEVKISEFVEEYHLKNDTIKKKQAPNTPVPATPPTPPTPGKFDQTPAEFPGGPNALRSSVSTEFDTAMLNGDIGKLKTIVYVSIDETGSVSKITAEGDNEVFNAEAIKAFKIANADKVWSPATEDSKPVKSVYKMPITMQFE